MIPSNRDESKGKTSEGRDLGFEVTNLSICYFDLLLVHVPVEACNLCSSLSPTDPKSYYCSLLLRPLPLLLPTQIFCRLRIYVTNRSPRAEPVETLLASTDCDRVSQHAPPVNPTLTHATQFLKLILLSAHFGPQACSCCLFLTGLASPFGVGTDGSHSMLAAVPTTLLALSTEDRYSELWHRVVSPTHISSKAYRVVAHYIV